GPAALGRCGQEQLPAALRCVERAAPDAGVRQRADADALLRAALEAAVGRVADDVIPARLEEAVGQEPGRVPAGGIQLEAGIERGRRRERANPAAMTLAQAPRRVRAPAIFPREPQPADDARPRAFP